MKGKEGFNDRQDRRRFFRMKPIEQLDVIVEQTGRQYQQDIRIRNDPRVFAEFKTRIWPIINTGCATSNCHSGPNAAAFRLHPGVPRGVEPLYTNFLTLSSFRGKDGRIIDRDQIQDSLLLHYGLPAGGTVKAHPGDPIKPLFRSKDDEKYKMFEDWLYLLVREPNYGVKVPGMEEEPAETEKVDKKE
jgi:hypothetical protein